MSILRSGVAGTTLATAAVTALAATLLTTSGSGAATAAPIKCDDTSTVDDPFYKGPPSSDTYDKGRFSDSWRLPDLRTHIPQGTATWSNWRGDDDLILVTGYQDDKSEARVNAIDAKTGQHVGFADILGFDGKDQYSHVGGIAVFEKKGWAYIPGPGDGTVRKYSLSKLKKALTTTKEIKPEGKEQIVHGNSFLTSHGPTNTLWAGQFFDARRGDMRHYVVADNGDLEPQEGIWEVPKKTQGLVVTEDLFIYSTSHGRNNRSNIYVVRRGDGSSDLDTARMYCFRSPSMSEGLAVYGNDVYVAYESGAAYYSQSGDKPDNVIEDLHKVPLSKLESLPRR